MKKTEHHISGLAIRFLKCICPDHLFEEIEGDLIQKFQRDVSTFGEGRARRRLVWNAIRFFRPGIVFRNNFSFNYNLMLRNHFKIAVRSTLRNKGFSAINIIGLATGITCTVLIMLWIQNELSYDRFHKDSDRLFEAWNRDTYDGEISCWSTTPRILAPTLKEEYPEVEEAVSFADYQMEFLISRDDTKFTDKSGVITSTGYLSMFSFPLLAGNPKTALDDPFSIVLTETFAKKIFGDDDALGEDVTLRYGTNVLNFTVTGVMKDLPNNTGFDFGYLLSWELMRAMGESDTYWGNNSVMTFVKLKPGVSIEEFNSKIKNIAITHSGGEQRNEVFLYPVSKLRLYSKFVNGIPQGGRIEVVILFGVIGFFIILISCINFMNLTTARCENRAKEVGVRKTIGARHTSLMGQFLTESLFIAIVAGILAMIAIHLLLPFFNTLTEKQLAVDYSNPQYWLGTFGVIILAGLLAGSYPALFLSSFKPISVLKGNYVSALSGATVRRGLVIFQFCFTIVLAIGTLVITEQINFAQKRETGYSKDNLIYHSISGDLNKNYTSYRKELIESGVAVSMSKTFSPITEQWSNTPGLQWQGKDPDLQTLFDRYSADEDLVATAGLELVAGRDLDLTRFPSDSSAALINESAAKLMNFKNPIGESFNDDGTDWLIAGVIKDFVARSPFQRPAPMVIEGSKKGWFYMVHIKLNDHLPLDESLARAESVFRKYNPEYPFEYHFADVEYERKFSEEKRIQKLATTSGTLAIFISCLGVLGLSIHIARRRIKEIGIRKVFGASTFSVMVLLSREPVKLILIAFLLAAPISWFAMSRWLEGYEYKVDIQVWVFILTAGAILLLTLITISIQTIRTAMSNPVNSLKHE